MRQHRIGTWTLSLLVAVGMLGMVGGTWAQDDPARTFGTAAEIAHVVTAAEFNPRNSNTPWDYLIQVDATSGVLGLTGGTGGHVFLAGLRLPAGAEVTRLEVAGCDSSVAGELQFSLLRSNVPPGAGLEVLTFGNTVTGATPGCGRFSVTPFSPPLIIDNANASYFVRVSTSGGNLFDSVRVFYRLQVSPAPAVASFGDVPTTHQFFQFIEALVASGITVGCDGANYCPDDPLTRGQMAVFLSKALGLHFAP
jgi:hypothetical protein